MNYQILEKIITDLGEPKFRLAQIKKAIFCDGIIDFEEITNLPKNLRQFLKDNINLLSLTTRDIYPSPNQDSIKASLATSDNETIETVVMKNIKDNWTVCVSSQIGCPLACSFCATGKLGFKRNLTAEEITDQIIFWKNYINKNNLEGKITNIVYMGMGEPFLNWDNVSESIRLLNQEDLFNIGSRSISVSTAGIPDKIIKFADTFPQVNLALSLHSAIQRKREEIMPIAKQYDLEELKKALNYYLSKTKRKIFIEYIMLDQFNDADNDLNELIKFFGEIKERYLLHLNLIPFNVTTSKHKPSSQKTMKHFQEMLIRNKIELTVRKSLGLDIDGACGQLGKK